MLRRLWNRADADWLAALVDESQVPWAVASRLRAVRSLGRPTRTMHATPDASQARTVIRWARREVEKPRVCPVVDARIPLWCAGARVGRERATLAVEDALTRLMPIREAVEELVQA